MSIHDAQRIPPTTSRIVPSRHGYNRLITTERLLRIPPMNVHCFVGTRNRQLRCTCVDALHTGATPRRMSRSTTFFSSTEFNVHKIPQVLYSPLLPLLHCWGVVCSVVVLFLSLCPPPSTELRHIHQFRWVHCTEQQLPHHQQQQGTRPVGNLIRITKMAAFLSVESTKLFDMLKGTDTLLHHQHSLPPPHLHNWVSPNLFITPCVFTYISISPCCRESTHQSRHVFLSLMLTQTNLTILKLISSKMIELFNEKHMKVHHPYPRMWRWLKLFYS